MTPSAGEVERDRRRVGNYVREIIELQFVSL